MEREENDQTCPWEMCPKSYFYTNYALGINRKVVSEEVRKLLFSDVNR